MEFGIIPECYGVSANAMFHDSVSEYFGSLRHTVIEDHNWQGEDSLAAHNSRAERKVRGGRRLRRLRRGQSGSDSGFGGPACFGQGNGSGDRRRALR